MNKDMGRILIRRGGETIGAGVSSIFSVNFILSITAAGIVLELMQ